MEAVFLFIIMFAQSMILFREDKMMQTAIVSGFSIFHHESFRLRQ